MDQAEKLRLLIKKQNKNSYSNKSIFFCSLTGGSGCTTVAYNTAKLLSKELKVLMIEYNFFAPSLSNYLGLINNFDFKDIFLDENYTKNIINITDNLDIFFVNILNESENIDVLKNNLINLEKYFKLNYNVIVFDLGSTFLLYNYKLFLDKIFFVAFSYINDYNNLYRFFSENKFMDKKADIIINRYNKYYKIKDKLYKLKLKRQNINDIYFIKHDKRLDKQIDFNDIRINSSLICTALEPVVNSIKDRLIEGVE